MEQRITKIEDKVNEVEKGYLKFEGMLNLIIYKIDDMKNNKAILEKDFPTLFGKEYAKQQSIRRKFISGIFFGLGVVLSTIVTILTGLADLIR